MLAFCPFRRRVLSGTHQEQQEQQQQQQQQQQQLADATIDTFVRGVELNAR